MRYAAVIFDLFGTLIDNYSVQDHRRVLGEVARALGAPEEGFARLWGETYNDRATGAFPTLEASIEHICRELDVQADAARMADALGIRLSLTRRTLVPRGDALETLAELRARGLKTGLISDCSEEVPRLWGETPFASAIEAPVFSCVAGVKKPDPRIYRLACEGLEVEPEACLYVGDGSSRELSGAAAVGMSPVLIRVPYEDTYEPHRIDVDEW
ncbi:MAG: HAD family hydrolase, partial [Armatimonadota bacterium]